MINYQAIFAGTMATFLWALLPALSKFSLPYVTVSQFLLIRFTISFSLLAYLTPRIFRKFHVLPWMAWISIFVCASTHNVTQAFCLKEVPVYWYILFFSTSPIFTYLMLPSKKQYVIYFYFILAIVGTIIFLQSTNIEITFSKFSVVCLFISVISWSVLTCLMIYFQKIYKDLEVTYILNLCNLVVAIIIFCTSEPNFTLTFSPSIFLIVLIGITSPLACFLFSFSLRLMPQFGIASQYLELVFGLIIGWVIFHEIPTYYEYIGSGLIILAMIGTTLHTNQVKNTAVNI